MDILYQRCLTGFKTRVGVQNCSLWRAPKTCKIPHRVFEKIRGCLPAPGGFSAADMSINVTKGEVNFKQPINLTIISYMRN